MSNFKELGLDKKKFVSDLEQLVAFPTVTGQPEGFAQAMDFIQDQISDKAHVTLLENNGEPILIASNKPGKQPDVCYLVHVDVVVANESQFTMQIDGDKVLGRGVSDMKYSIPIGYELLNQLIEDESDLSFALAITSDEERGGFKGAGFLADEYQLQPKIVICPDGGNNFVIVNKSKGVLHLRASAPGIPAHASSPWHGKNALRPVVELAQQLFEKYDQANAEEGWNTTLNVGIISGGKMINQVPAQATMDLDFRFVPETDSYGSLQTMVSELATQIDDSIQFEVLAKGEAMFTEPTNPVLQMFMQIVGDALGEKLVLEGGNGSNDARHFNKYGAPVLMTKPEGGDIHGDAEWLDVPSTLLYADMLYAFLQAYAAYLQE